MSIWLRPLQAIWQAIWNAVIDIVWVLCPYRFRVITIVFGFLVAAIARRASGDFRRIELSLHQAPLHSRRWCNREAFG